MCVWAMFFHANFTCTCFIKVFWMRCPWRKVTHTRKFEVKRRYTYNGASWWKLHLSGISGLPRVQKLGSDRFVARCKILVESMTISNWKPLSPLQYAGFDLQTKSSHLSEVLCYHPETIVRLQQIDLYQIWISKFVRNRDVVQNKTICNGGIRPSHRD